MFLDILLSEGPLVKQLLDVDGENRVLLGNLLVHQRLGEAGLVGLVVPVLAVADEIDNDITLVLRTPVGSQLADEVNGLGVVGVDVEDGGVNGLRNVRAVRSGTGKPGVGGETDLVVDNDVDGTSGGESRQSVEAEGLVNDTLCGEGSITVQQNAHGGLVFDLIVVEMLDGTGLSKNHGVISLQVRGVGNQRQLNALSGRSGSLKVHTQMVLDVTGTLITGLGRTAELAENGFVGFPHDVGQNVETTTVGHTDNHVLNTIVHRAIDQSLHSGNQGLTALETESLVVGVFGGKEGLERGRPDETVQNPAFLVLGILVGRRDLDTLSDPVALIPVGNVNVLDSDGAAVDPLAGRDDLPQSHLFPTSGSESGQDTRSESVFVVQVLRGELVVVQLQLPRPGLSQIRIRTNAEGIDLCFVVSTNLVGTDKELHLQMLGDVGVTAEVGAGDDRWDTAGGGGDDGGRCLERLRSGPVALHVTEVDLPRDVDTGRVFFPGHIHFIDVVGGVSLQEGIIGILVADEGNTRQQFSPFFRLSKPGVLGTFPGSSVRPRDGNAGDTYHARDGGVMPFLYGERFPVC